MLVWSICLSNMFEACSESDSLFRTWSKHEATMARSRIECKTTQLLIQWTLVTFCHHSVISLSSSCHPWTLVAALKGLETLEDYGVIWCDPHSRRSHWVLNLELFHVWNMQHHTSHTMRQSLYNYIHHWFHVCFLLLHWDLLRFIPEGNALVAEINDKFVQLGIQPTQEARSIHARGKIHYTGAKREPGTRESQWSLIFLLSRWDKNNMKEMM